MNDAEHPHMAELDVDTDEAIADMILLMNRLGVPTTGSRQVDHGDGPQRAGSARRAWICTWTWALPNLIALLEKPAELDDLESLSNRIAPERVPFNDFFDDDFDLNRKWHYTIRVHRTDGCAVPDRLDIRMPVGDVEEVVRRLRMVGATPSEKR